MIRRIGEELWRVMPDGNEKRQLYYCTREWSEKKEAVRSRSQGICEQCGMNYAENVHHKTYARLYDEPLNDLWHLCRECHEFLHGKGELDPLVKRMEALKAPQPIRESVGAGKSTQRVGWSVLKCPFCHDDYVHAGTTHVLSKDGIVIGMWCESGHEWEMVIETDKGNTYACTRNLHDREA